MSSNNGRWSREACILAVVLFAATVAALADTAAKTERFNPKDLDNLEFFIESVNGMVIAKNTSPEAYDQTGELTPTELVWSDGRRFPHGTVRWWWDQSPKGKPSRRKNKPFKTGRAFGQDDHDRPGYIPDGCNGKPCARGGLVPDGEKGKYKHHRKQPCYFELQPEDRFEFEGPFSVFLLVRPIQQERDFVYFGVFHWSTLKHRISDNSLHFNSGRFSSLTGAGAVEIDRWQLIEVHRDRQNRLQCVINGRDLTQGTPGVDGPFKLVHIMNNNKNVWSSADPFAGELAAFLLYSDELTEQERQSVRGYFDGVYDFKNSKADGSIASSCGGNPADVPGPYLAPGYVARPCGLDMNRDGVTGDPADAKVANGQTTDPDGDNVNEDLIYVDARRGSDERGDGSPIQPYMTIQKALDACDGSGDGAEDIICICGVFHEAITIKQGGIPGHYQRSGFQYPKNPLMIIGWDRDGDGQYPPYDEDDVAVLDGSRPGRLNRPLAISNRPGNHSHIEIAHLTIRNYGHDAPRQGDDVIRGAFAPAGGGIVNHIYLHDVAMQSINEGTHTDGHGHVVYFWVGGQTRFTWFAFEDNLVDRFSGYGFRGIACNGSGHFRLRRNTFRMSPGVYKYTGTPDLGITWKVWNNYTHLEFLDNLVEGCPVEAARTIGGVGFGVRPAVQDVVIRGNRFVNLKTAVSVDGNAPGYAQDRCVDRVTVEDNTIVNKWSKYPPEAFAGPIGIYLPDGGDLKNTVRSVTLRGNTLIFSQPNARGILCIAGNDEGPQQGTIRIEGNQFFGPGHGRDYFALRMQSRNTYPQQDFVVTGNRFLKTGPDGHNVIADYAPRGWKANHNVYHDGLWKWRKQHIADLPAWQKATGQDADARVEPSPRSDPERRHPSARRFP